MNQTEFIARLAELYALNVEISRKKNADYGAENDPFLNFRGIEVLTKGRISTADGILVRISDKVQRIANLIDGTEAQVLDESLLDSLSDCANYLMILRMWLEEKK